MFSRLFGSKYSNRNNECPGESNAKMNYKECKHSIYEKSDTINSLRINGTIIRTNRTFKKK